MCDPLCVCTALSILGTYSRFNTRSPWLCKFAMRAVVAGSDFFAGWSRRGDRRARRRADDLAGDASKSVETNTEDAGVDEAEEEEEEEEEDGDDMAVGAH